jgi:hypothetical protein
MPETLFDPQARRALAARIEQLSPGAQPRWGRMNASQMLAHTRHQLEVGLGVLKIPPMAGFLRFRPLNWFIIYWMRWPKGAPTAPQLVDPATGAWEEEKRMLLEAIERFGARAPSETWGEHPAFGVLPGKDWGVLAWRHLDWHLRQFGV